MGTDTFRRHTRACVDAAIHHVFTSQDRSRDRSFFARLLCVAGSRSDLMANAPTVEGEVVQVSALRNISRFRRAVVRPPEDWPGATGHPLRVIDSLAGHLFGCYPTPRFLASAWFGGSTPDALARRRWFIAHARGQRFRSLALPLVMTRHMEHVFLKTPDHVVVDHALRRAEVLGLGGTPELADAVLKTRLAGQFRDPDRWRIALAWLVGCGDAVDLAQVGPMIDYLQVVLAAIDLRGRTFASVMRLVSAWHESLGSQRMRFVVWPRSRWRELGVPVEPTWQMQRGAEWSIRELLDSQELAKEGRAMRHCVASYTTACANRSSSIWSLRHRWEDDEVGRSVLTIEVRPSTGTIVQIRGKANAPAEVGPMQIVRRWAVRERLLGAFV